MTLPTRATLLGNRVSLRPWTEADTRALVQVMDDAEIAFRTPLPSPFTNADARRYIADRTGYLDFAVVELDGAVVGQIMLSRTIHMASYAIAQHARGRGLAAAALMLLCRHARQWGLASVGLEIEPSNVASRAVARSCGFRRTEDPPEEVSDKGRTYWLETWRLHLSQAESGPSGDARR